ncbi:SAV_915 family protein [Actinomycetospora sp. CA-084318]|uniref:SAV_915 family protein n=1 Tax=Actinomycetospora sp. CA-084318 TaxID=3239892 RepID=UPI003D9892D9
MEIVVAADDAPPLGPEPVVPEPDEFLDGRHVFIPVHEVPTGAQALVELRTLTDGRLALPVFSSATSLVRCCGPGQPYGVFAADDVADLLTVSGAQVVGADLPLPLDLRREAA